MRRARLKAVGWRPLLRLDLIGTQHLSVDKCVELQVVLWVAIGASLAQCLSHM